jgi:hypothetical protein
MPTHTTYDDRWMRDVMSRLRIRDAAGAIEREFEAVCSIVTRADIERALGRPLDGEEWQGLRDALREEAASSLLRCAPEVLDRTDGAAPAGS